MMKSRHTRSELAKRGWHEKLCYRGEHPGKGRELIFNRLLRGGRAFAQLNRTTILILRWAAARRRRAYLQGLTVPGFTRLSDELEAMLAKREGRPIRLMSCRRWYRQRLENSLRRIAACPHPAFTTAIVCLPLMPWPHVPNATGLNPYTLQPWNVTHTAIVTENGCRKIVERNTILANGGPAGVINQHAIP